MKRDPEIKFILTPGVLTTEDGNTEYFCRIRKCMKDRALFSYNWITWRQVDFPVAVLGTGSLRDMEREIFKTLKSEYIKHGIDNMAVEIH